MDRNHPNENPANASGRPDSTDSNDPIQERLLDGREDSQESIVDAARQSFERDQQDPDHPTRIERRAGDIEDPSHSRGSGA